MSPTELPPLVLIGPAGAGRRTVVGMLHEIAGYGEGASFQDGRHVLCRNLRECVEERVEKGYRCVYIYASLPERLVRLRAAGRLAVGEPCPDDHGPVNLAEHSIANIGTLDELREEVADLLNRIQT